MKSQNLHQNVLLFSWTHTNLGLGLWFILISWLSQVSLLLLLFLSKCMLRFLSPEVLCFFECLLALVQDLAGNPKVAGSNPRRVINLLYFSKILAWLVGVWRHLEEKDDLLVSRLCIKCIYWEYINPYYIENLEICTTLCRFTFSFHTVKLNRKTKQSLKQVTIA